MIRKALSMQGVELAVFLLLLVVMVGQSVYLLTYVKEQREVQQTLQCQSNVNAEFRQALTQRSDAAAQERQAQRKLLTAMLSDPRATQAALHDYLSALDSADAERVANPLPSSDC